MLLRRARPGAKDAGGREYVRKDLGGIQVLSPFLSWSGSTLPRGNDSKVKTTPSMGAEPPTGLNQEKKIPKMGT